MKKGEIVGFPLCPLPQLSNAMAPPSTITFSQGEELTHLLAGHPHFVELPFQPQQPDQLHVAVVVIAVDRQLRGKSAFVTSSKKRHLLPPNNWYLPGRPPSEQSRTYPITQKTGEKYYRKLPPRGPSLRREHHP